MLVNFSTVLNGLVCNPTLLRAAGAGGSRGLAGNYLLRGADGEESPLRSQSHGPMAITEVAPWCSWRSPCSFSISFCSWAPLIELCFSQSPYLARVIVAQCQLDLCVPGSNSLLSTHHVVCCRFHLIGAMTNWRRRSEGEALKNPRPRVRRASDRPYAKRAMS